VIIPEEGKTAPRQSIVFFVHPDDEVLLLLSLIQKDPKMELAVGFSNFQTNV
jgi:hypothetical protein